MENITLNTFVSDLRLEAQKINILHKISVFKVYEFLLLNNLSKELANLNVRLSIVVYLLDYQNTTLKLIETNSKPTIISDKHLEIWNYILSKFSRNTKGYLDTMSINSLADFVSVDFESSLSTQKFAKDSFQEIELIQNKLKRMNLVSEQKQKKTERTFDIKSSEATIAVSEQKQVEVNSEVSEELFKINDAFMLDMVRNQLGNKAHILDKLRIQTYDQLKAQSEDDFSYMLGSGSIMAIHIQNAISTVESKAIKTNDKLEYKSLKDFPLWNGTPILNKDIPAKFKPDFNVYEGVLYQRCVNALKSLDLNTIGEVLLTFPEKLLALPSVGSGIVNRLRVEIKNFIAYESVESENLDFGKSFSDFISILCRLREVSEEHTNILLELLCGDNIKHFTRSELGAKYGCSGERIRQILTLRVDQIKSAYKIKEYVNRFNTVLLEAINVAGGIIHVDELSSRVATTMNWDASLKGYMLGLYIKSFTLDNGEELLGDILSVKSPYRENEDITCKLQELVESTGKVSFNYLRETLNSFSKSLRVHENFSYIENDFSKAFIIEYATKLGLKYDTINVYGLRSWRLKLKKGGLNKKVEAILFSTLRPMTPQEVSDILNKKFHTDYYDKLRIYKALTSDPGCVVWGHNEFIHNSVAFCSDDTLNIISSTISERLTKSQFVSLKSIYNEFYDIFKKEKIPNKFALGAVISLRLPEYYIERYRYVYAKKPKKTTSVNKIAEKWVRSAGKPVSRCDLGNYLFSKIGRETNSVYFLYNIPAIIQNASGYLIHLDNMNVKKDNILELQEYISKELKLFDQIGVNKVFDEYQKYLSQYQILDSKMLYGVLKNYCSSIYSFPIFPNIRSIETKGAITLNKILSKFILEQGTIVLKNDCDKYFKQMGYIDFQTKPRIIGEPSILEYSIDSVVHKNTISWTEIKMTNLLKLLTNAYSEAISSGFLFGDLEKFFATYKKHLPLLDNNIKWTEKLLHSIVSQMPEVSIVGNAKRAYIIQKISANNILNLEDLICYVVKNYFDKRCSREELNQWMKDNGVVRKSITTKMFTPSKKLIVNENECRYMG